MPVKATQFMAAAALALYGALAAAADFTWRVPTSVPEGSPFYVNFLERFAKHVATLTDGKVEIQPFGAGVIVPALQVYEAVQGGVVEAGHSTPSYLVNQDPINGIFAGFPGGMGPQAYITWIYEGGGKQKLEALRAKSGLKTLVVGIGATEVLAGTFQQTHSRYSGLERYEISHPRPVDHCDARLVWGCAHCSAAG